MCGIVAVVQAESGRTAPAAAEVVAILEAALGKMPSFEEPQLAQALDGCAAEVDKANALMSGVAGLACLCGDATAIPVVENLADQLWRAAEELESLLDERPPEGVGPRGLEQINAALVKLKDAIWAVRKDRVGTVAATLDLAGRDAADGAFGAFAQMAIALSAIDRLEVRGRDSAGLVVIVRDHGLDLDAPSVRPLLEERAKDVLFRSMSVRRQGEELCFTYKAAAEIGELGDNTRAIRESIRSDSLLHLVLASPQARCVVLGHTRWASVGMISEPNAHPLSSEEATATQGPMVFAALNGDIDNHVDLSAAEDLQLPLEISTDAKIIPVLVARRMREGLPLEEAFRRTVSSFEGSVAVAAVSLDASGRLLLALRGSGQALYVGLSEDAFVVASEPYGLVEQASRYLRMDGESLLAGSNARGQIVVLDESAAGKIEGLKRYSYDGTELPVIEDEVQRAEITTRDVDRGDFPHFLLKEIHESPRSFRKTLRGRLVERHGTLRVEVGDEALPQELKARLASGRVRRIVVIGQGTAAVAGRALAAALARGLAGAPVRVEALAATELSGFGLTEDMSDTLLVAISQSGTTTDTNRTVEVARARGAMALAIVNRRQSDLTDRSDGVLFTSDGRDVEMAVPSTKAFYSQVAAGFLLAAAISAEVPGVPGIDESVLRSLRELPDAMERVLELRGDIAEIARRHAPHRREWAVVGNGPNRVAAEEVRIKLSELCYKSIACDITEDKKHIDLSAEPLILVCAAGLQGGNAEDVAKEVAIYRAHKAAPLVIAGEGEGNFDAALDVIRVPHTHPDVAFVLSAMAGHLFGYEAALAIDAQAQPLRAARAAIEEVAEDTKAFSSNGFRLMDRLKPVLGPLAGRFFESLRSGAYDGHLEASTAVRIASLLRYATGAATLETYQIEYGKIGTPGEMLTDLIEALTTGIDDLTRPIDAIRHQAKTVTVGITRAEETLLRVPLVAEVLNAGVPRDRLTYANLRALAALDPSIERVTGFTHYLVEGDPEGEAFVRITDRGGIARDIPSRTDRDPRLRGTKHRVAYEREVLVTRGGDGRTLVIVPEVKGAQATGIALLHVLFKENLPADVMRGVLQGYRERYFALRDIVTETEPTFRDDLLAEIPVVDLLIMSIQALAQRWRPSAP